MNKETKKEKAEDQADKSLREAEEERRRLNRQVNFYIMRYMWQRICGRDYGDQGNTIYSALNFSRERYTRIIDTGRVRFFQDELNWLSTTTGLYNSIFTGERQFEVGTGKSKLTSEDWSKFFEYRGQQQKSLLKKKKTYIEEKLKEAYKSNTEKYEDFYRLCYFLKKKKPLPDEDTLNKLFEIQSSIKQLDFRLLDSLTIRKLQDLLTILKETHQLTQTVYEYKVAREETENKGKQ